jgi:hypothetical protein
MATASLYCARHSHPPTPSAPRRALLPREHSFIVRVLRARRAPGRSPLSFWGRALREQGAPSLLALLSPLMASCDPLETWMAHLLEYVGSVHIYLGPYRGNPISLYLKRLDTGCQIGPKAYPWNDVVGSGETPNKAAADFEEKWKAKGLSADMYSGPSWEGGIKPEKPAPPKPPAAPKPAAPAAASAPDGQPSGPAGSPSTPADASRGPDPDLVAQPADESS